MEMEKVKTSIDNLISREIIMDKGKEGNESFVLVDITSDGEKVLSESEKVVNNTQAGFEHETSFTALHEFIDERFYSTLINRIKSEVQIAVNELINNDLIVKRSNDKNEPVSKGNKSSQDLITVLMDEVKFLRNELTSKDKIIEIMVKDLCTGNVKSSVNGIDPELNHGVENAGQHNNGDVRTGMETKKEEIHIKKKRTIAILGDSMLKDIDQHKVSQGLGNKEKVYVKSFSGATIDHMKSYIIPTKEYNNDLIVLHCGTNDLRSGKTSHDIARGIIDIAMDMKTDNNDVMVSAILPRRDSLNAKGMEVNSHLKNLCDDNNIHFIDNINVKSKYHLNGSGLHLNIDGTYIVGSNFVNALKL